MSECRYCGADAEWEATCHGEHVVQTIRECIERTCERCRRGESVWRVPSEVGTAVVHGKLGPDRDTCAAGPLHLYLDAEELKQQ